MQSTMVSNRLAAPGEDEFSTLNPLYDDILENERPVSPCYQEPVVVRGRRKSSIGAPPGAIRRQSSRESLKKSDPLKGGRRRSSGASVEPQFKERSNALVRNDTLNIMALLKDDAERKSEEDAENRGRTQTSSGTAVGIKSYKIEKVANAGNGTVTKKTRGVFLRDGKLVSADEVMSSDKNAEAKAAMKRADEHFSKSWFEGPITREMAQKQLRAKEGTFLVRTKPHGEDHAHVLSCVSDGRSQHWRLFLPRPDHPNACMLEDVLMPGHYTVIQVVETLCNKRSRELLNSRLPKLTMPAAAAAPPPPPPRRRGDSVKVQ